MITDLYSMRTKASIFSMIGSIIDEMSTDSLDIIINGLTDIATALKNRSNEYSYEEIKFTIRNIINVIGNMKLVIFKFYLI
jgi:hypothetical protein